MRSDDIRKESIRIIDIPEGLRERECIGVLFQRNKSREFLKPWKGVSEAKRTPGYLNVMRPTSKHSAYTIKSSKQRIVKVVGGKGPIYKSTPIRLSLDFSRTSVDQERME